MSKPRKKINPRKGVSSSKPKAPPKNDKRRKNVSTKSVSRNRPENKSTGTGTTKRTGRVNASKGTAAKGKGQTKVITAAPIQINKDAINKLRKQVRKSDGTFFTKEYYEKLLKQQKGKSQDEVDDLLIKLRNKNPKLRYFVESKSDTLHFQTGSFVDRLSGKIETVKVQKGKRKGKAVKTGDLKSGTKVTITDFFGDEVAHKSIAAANEVIKEQNNIINNIISRLQKESKLPKGKKLGIYVTIPEKVTSNSEGEIVNISYDYSDITVQGMERAKFDIYLDDELEAIRAEDQRRGKRKNKRK